MKKTLYKLYYGKGCYWKGEGAVDKEHKHEGPWLENDLENEHCGKSIYRGLATFPCLLLWAAGSWKPAIRINLIHSVKLQTFRSALTVMDVTTCSRYKEAEPIMTKASSQALQAFVKIHRRSPLTFPRLIKVEAGSEFKRT